MDRQNLAYQVSTTLGDHPEDFNIDDIVQDLIDEHGPIDSIDDVDTNAYWATVEKHDTAS